MIIEVPTRTDFEHAGIDYLNLGWDAVSELVLDFRNRSAAEWGDEWKDNQTAHAKYWEAAQRKLAVGLSLTYQGVELLLKGRICEVSPFLLLSEQRDWPACCAQSDTSFADSRTIDAQQLMRIHDTVCATRLSDETKRRIEELRRRRNTVTHSVDRRLRLTSEKLLQTILEVSNELIGFCTWIEHRYSYLVRTPAAVAHADDYSEFSMLPLLTREVEALIEFLSPANCQRLLGFNKKHRRYYCPSCLIAFPDIYGKAPKLAVLMPNQPRSKKLICVVCGKAHEVFGQCAPNPDAKGTYFGSPINGTTHA